MVLTLDSSRFRLPTRSRASSTLTTTSAVTETIAEESSNHPPDYASHENANRDSAHNNNTESDIFGEPSNTLRVERRLSSDLLSRVKRASVDLLYRPASPSAVTNSPIRTNGTTTTAPEHGDDTATSTRSRLHQWLSRSESRLTQSEHWPLTNGNASTDANGVANGIPRPVASQHQKLSSREEDLHQRGLQALEAAAMSQEDVGAMEFPRPPSTPARSPLRPACGSASTTAGAGKASANGAVGSGVASGSPSPARPSTAWMSDAVLSTARAQNGSLDRDERGGMASEAKKSPMKSPLQANAAERAQGSEQDSGLARDRLGVDVPGSGLGWDFEGHVVNGQNG